MTDQDSGAQSDYYEELQDNLDDLPEGIHGESSPDGEEINANRMYQSEISLQTTDLSRQSMTFSSVKK